MPSTYPTPTNLTGFGDMAQYIVSVDGNFFNFLLLTLWIIMFIYLNSSQNTTAGASFTIASWITFIFALLLEIVGVIHNSALLWSILACALGFVWMWNEARS